MGEKMKVEEVIRKLEKLNDRYGNVEFHIYKSFSKETYIGLIDIFYDEEIKDICMGIYA